MTGLGDGLLDAGQRRLEPFVDREDAELGPLVVGHVLDRQTAEEVVHDRRGEADVGIVGHARWLEPHVGERLDERPQRHPVLEAVADRLRKGIHHARHRRALLRHGEEDLTGLAVVVLADRGETLAVGDAELERATPTGSRHLLADRLVHDPLDHLLHAGFDGGGCR